MLSDSTDIYDGDAGLDYRDLLAAVALSKRVEAEVMNRILARPPTSDSAAYSVWKRSLAKLGISTVKRTRIRKDLARIRYLEARYLDAIKTIDVKNTEIQSLEERLSFHMAHRGAPGSVRASKL